VNDFVLVQASAGSGKTTALVVRYLSLLFLNQSSSKILALTFTNKAVQEMKHRIINVIYNLDSNMDYVEQISNTTSLPVSEILSKKNEVLNRFLSDSSHIVTFDKFFNKILRLFCFYGDVSIDFNVKDSIENTKFLNYFLDDLSSSEIQNLIKISNSLNTDIVNIVNLLFVLFDKDEEISSLIDTDMIIDNDIQDKIFEQINLLKNIVYDNPISSASAKKAFDNIDNIEDLLNKKTWIQKKSLEEYSYFKKIYTQNMDDIFFKLKNLLVKYYHQKQNIFLSSLFVSYNSFKMAKNKYQKFYNELSFSDVVNMVHSILKNNINTDFLYFRLDSKISHILIDELQDTSMREYKILQPIIEEILSGVSAQDFRTLFFVGDKKQSIYGFKGAKKELVEDIASVPQIQTSVLDTNYRSSKAIVELTNSIFSSQYSNYIKQKCHSSNVGYTKICTTSKEDIKATFMNTLKEMLNKGYAIKDIAVLGFKNKDLLIVNDWIKQEFPNMAIITDITSKLIEYPKVKAIIELINYMYFGDEVYVYNFSHITSNLDIGKLKDEARQLYENHKIKNTDMHSLVFSIILKYKLYDENTLSFLEKVSHFRDMIDFIYNISDMDGKIVSSSMNGIRLITIHKSKGLEFDNVILIDQIGGDYRGSSPLLFSYDGLRLDSVFLKIKNREFIDKNYSKAINIQNKNKIQDIKNVLYVAITRAKNNIFIIQKDKKSKFDILNLPEESTGEFTSTTNKEAINKEAENNNLVLNLKKYGLQKDFLHREISISQDIDIKSIQNMEYGNAMHYMFECLHHLDKSSIDIAFHLTQNKYGFNISKNALIDIKNIVLKSLDNEQFKNLIQNKTIKKELSFKYKQQIGVVDLLLEDDKNIYIIDYKTSSSQSMPSYVEQINFYKKAIKDLHNKPTIGYLFFVGEQSLVEVK